MLARANEVLTVAVAYDGKVEQPPASNNGLWLQTLLRGSSWTAGSAYCYYAAVACVAHALGGYHKLPEWISQSGECHVAANLAREHGKLTADCATGCIALYKGGDTGHYHAGLVVCCNPVIGKMLSFEFNHENGCSFVVRDISEADYIVY